MKAKSLGQLTEEYNALATKAGLELRKSRFRDKEAAAKAIKGLTLAGKKKTVEFTSDASKLFNSIPGSEQDKVINALIDKWLPVDAIRKVTGGSKGAINGILKGIRHKTEGKNMRGKPKPPYTLAKEKKDGVIHFAILNAS